MVFFFLGGGVLTKSFDTYLEKHFRASTLDELFYSCGQRSLKKEDYFKVKLKVIIYNVAYITLNVNELKETKRNCHT